jgi:uncharacterized membrane protein YbhN (UPF0104 family)
VISGEPVNPTRGRYVSPVERLGAGEGGRDARAGTDEESSARLSRTSWARLLGSAGVLSVLVWRLGTGPFLDGVRTVGWRSLTAASVIAAVTTVCCAWRWQTVVRGLGVDLPFGAAVSAYYRSLFLNAVLPGGVVGDVHRGVRHGHDVGDLGRGLRAVAWERTAGQVVQVVLTMVVLLTFPSPVRASMPVVAAVVVVLALCIPPLVRLLPEGEELLLARAWRAARSDVRDGLLVRRAWPRVVLASLVAGAGYAGTFLIAARTAGVTASFARLVPLALLVLLGATLPSLAGWGPREGMAAWAFAAAGLGEAQGVATAVVYGVLAVVSSLPGAVVLVVGWLRQRTRRGQPAARRELRVSVAAGREGCGGD